MTKTKTEKLKTASLVLVMLACFLCWILTGCSDDTLSVTLAGNSVVIVDPNDFGRQLITDEEDVKELQEAFSGAYEEVASFDDEGGDYLLYFGNDLNTELESSEDYFSIAVIDGRAYVIEGDKVYRSVDEIDLSVLE